MTDFTESENLLDRTLRRAWRALSGVARGEQNGEIGPDLPESDSDRLMAQIRDCLEARGGEVSARVRAADLGRAYLSLNKVGRQRFLGLLSREVSTDPEIVAQAVSSWQQSADDEGRQLAERDLRAALRPPRFTLYRQFTALPEGVKFLVDLRAEVLRFSKHDPALKVIDEELKSLLLSWFDFGFLELTRIEWDSPASVLEKLIEYEAVHRIHDWDDLKNRLESDRRCFGFFHPGMPNEPLIFVEVALVNGMAGNVQQLLDTEAPIIDPQTADAAIFYSISNAQRGLAGISFGDFLIKRVVDVLAVEFKGIKTFATLSPLPGFRDWLLEYLQAMEAGHELLSAAERKRLPDWTREAGDCGQILSVLNEANWYLDVEYAEALTAVLFRLCAHYLGREKRAGGLAKNPVAHFHLSNGARIERLNWLADTSENGMRQSFGLMVNYLYKRSDIEKNHESYRGSGRIALSSTLKSMLK